MKQIIITKTLRKNLSISDLPFTLSAFISLAKTHENETINPEISSAEKIEKNLTYPGQIRVTVIRERRAVGLAK